MQNEALALSELANNLWTNYIKPKYERELSENITYYRAVVTQNNEDGTVLVKTPGEAEHIANITTELYDIFVDTPVIVLKFGNGNAAMNHVVFAKLETVSPSLGVPVKRLIRERDEVEPIDFYAMFSAFLDTATITKEIPQALNCNDTIVFDFMDIFAGFRDSGDCVAKIMVFTPFVNVDMITTNCEYNDTKGWIGAGTILEGDSLYVITDNVYGVTHATVTDSNGVYYASFDNGITWMGWTGESWVEEAPMIADTLAATPASAWSYSSPVRIKAALETDSSLFTINLYGGTVQ